MEREQPGALSIDPTGDVGKYSSMVLGLFDTPHISYYDETNKNLNYIT